jgi:two-component sensor histidine kinase
MAAALATHRLRPEPDAVGHARAFTRSLLVDGHADPATIQVALLLVSELVTNAVKHARTKAIELSLQLSGGILHVEVADDDPRRPLPVTPTVEGGRGLYLIEALAQSHGDRPRQPPPGKLVWFDLPCSPIVL